MKNTFLYILALVLSVSAHSQSVVRELSESHVGNNGSIKVKLTISKAGIVGTGKIVEKIPKGFSAAVFNKAGGKVKTMDDGRVKIQWMALPANDEFIVEYHLLHLGLTTETASIEGTFSYLSEGRMQKVLIAASTITVGESSAPVAKKVIVKKEPVKKKVVKKAPVVQEPVVVAEPEPEPIPEPAEVIEAEPVVETASAPKPKPRPKPAASTSKNTSGKVMYTVQVGAFSTEKEMSYFGSLTGIYYELIDGLYKYRTGNFDTKLEAEWMREEAWNKGYRGAFVVTK